MIEIRFLSEASLSLWLGPRHSCPIDRAGERMAKVRVARLLWMEPGYR